MKITLCGSTAFIDEMEALSKQLEDLGHEIQMPPVIVTDKDGNQLHTRDYYKMKKSTPFNDPDFWKNHTDRIRAHFDKVAWGDAVLITNYGKNNIPNYIGPNTLMEMGVAFHLHKKIFLLNPVPEIAWQEEILGMRPVVINNNFELLI